MSELFLKIVNMSISASWLVLAVLVLRLLLKKAPKWVNVLLWGIVAVRLLCPFSIESALSLIPSSETISPGIMMDQTPAITTGIPALNSAVNPIISESFAPAPGDSANPLQIWIPLAGMLWAVGAGLMLLYAAVSYLRLRKKVATAVILRDNIFRSEYAGSPFVLGIFRPKIYLPYALDAENTDHVIAHEQAHIRRKDHWWKPLGYALLTLHWFNPLMWLAYILLCRDIELACDEKVIAELGNEQRADYTQALVACSVRRRSIAACPLAFGEVGVKERVKSIMNYRRPAFWVIVTAVVVCAIVAACFLTDPEPSREFPMNGTNVADLDADVILNRIEEIERLDSVSVYTNANNFSLTVTSDFEWADSQAVRYFFYENQDTYCAQLRIFPEEGKFLVTESDQWPEQDRIFLLYHYLWALKSIPQETVRQMCPDADGYIIRQLEEGKPDDYDRVITYSEKGAGEIDGWTIHLELQPLHDDGEGLSGTGDEVIHLFYGGAARIPTSGIYEWVNFDDVSVLYENYVYKEIAHPAIPGVTFRYTAAEITAEDESGETTLITGMPIRNAYFTDLTGDGIPELCATVNYGSGLVDAHVAVYDYAAGQQYTLWARGSFDYLLRLEDGRLLCDQFAYAGVGPVGKGQGEPLATGALMLADAAEGKYLTMENAVTLPVSMQPTEADLRGSVAGYLFVPIDGATFRYQLTDPRPGNVTAGQLLDTFIEQTINEDVVWEVYALNEYPDITKVLLISDTNTAWLCEYAPAKRADEDALQWAKNDGCVIVEDGVLTDNRDTWLKFYEDTRNGIPASVMVAWYHTLDPETTVPETYEACQEDYPMLSVHELSYDGEVYTIYTDDGVRTYEYLMKYTGKEATVSWNEIDEYTRYVLTHSNTVTWQELWRSLLSSASDVAIDHYRICTEIY